MKILIIGSTGIVGSAFKRNRTKSDTYFFEDHSTLEIKNRDQMLARLAETRPDVVINTAAYVGVNPCAEHQTEAYAVNAEAVRDLAEICKQLNICLAHLSTDAVFDGQKGDSYTEEDAANPLNVYGKSKHAGDLFVEDICKKYYIFRLPILFGTRENKGNIFIEKMHKLAASGTTELLISDDVFSCPSFSDDLAREILRLIKAKLAHGLYHLKNEGKASLFEFASTFFAKLGLEINIKRAKAKDFAYYDKEPKPLDTAIKSIKIKHLRPWEEAMDDFVVQFKNKEVK
ncbi:hypothetical protein A3F86_03300 [candidate division WOR-1 bacterium RIFCSPLOWO2_12_FULL_45_9]|uniref:dTDP-4-dehydrorhamnose reductase n=1 Tax=candidate division WOR-1 bacterium RIFCSPLOWO2_12_FULL_45_9 TaxID=1802568 RepID=A0A1F4RRI2_UNCSA|nr:MAG: hypothetical protein A3F86_03300 [candidate division WOR-1 bacterium RIFCSPLOWO2_12_FULL_45_9]